MNRSIPALVLALTLFAPAAFARFGGQFLARGGESDVLEGPQQARHVVIAFPDLVYQFFNIIDKTHVQHSVKFIKDKGIDLI